ncbi:hypothetical protein PIB30_002480 [Stylosanthes scabra]|uniref:Uncharacterized protein n=1 Tax=Stylosanthes scabra TaxID=79078 RepID=A0ABU6X4X8_9FABA|nr:hypothetical protein [Stylosanthes scabra]
MQANPQGLAVLDPSSGQASSSAPKGGGSSNVGGGGGTTAQIEVSSPIQEEGTNQQIEVVHSPPSKKRGNDEMTSAQKRPRVSDGSQRDFCPIDRSFDASGFIERNFLGPRAMEALRDYDPMESTRWVQWVMLRSATILKSVEPRLTMADQWERRCTCVGGKQGEGFRGPASEGPGGQSVGRFGIREGEARADKAEASLVTSEERRQQLIKLAEDFVKATEDALKEQILALVPDFDVSLLGAWKEVVDGQIIDPPLGP